MNYSLQSTDNTLPDTHTLPSRLPSQLSKHSCQNSGTSNTTIVRCAWEGQSQSVLSWHWASQTLWTGLTGWFHISCITSLFFFFFPFTSFCHSCNSPPSLSNTLSFLPSVNLCLPFAPGTVHCCFTSALITAPGRPPSTSRLACESTHPRGVITLKSSKSGHVKLSEVFREPTQVSKGVNWKLLEARFACQNTLDDLD